LAAFVLFTLIWGLVGGLAPRYVPLGPNRELLQLMLVMTAICCWFFWFLCYLAQMNPLMGPTLEINQMAAVVQSWGKFD